MSDLTESAVESVESVDAEVEAVAVAPPEQVEVRRNGALAAVVGSMAAVVAVAYLARASSSDSLVDWLLFLALGALALAQGAAFLDARTPLLVADRTGIRLRLGRTWHGLPWEELEEVEHAPRRSLLRDGRLVAFPADEDAALAALDPMARRQAAISHRVHGAPFAVPLGLTTVVTGAGGGLTAALLALAPDANLVVEVVPASPEHAVDEVWDEPGSVSPLDGAGATDEVQDRAYDEVADVAYDVEVEAPELAAPSGSALSGSAPSGPASIGSLEDPDATRVRANPFRRHRHVRDDRDDDPADVSADGIDDTAERPLVATRTPSPLRSPVTAVRSDVVRPVRTAPHDGGSSMVSGSNALATVPSEVRVTVLPEADELRRTPVEDLDDLDSSTAMTVVTAPQAAPEQVRDDVAPEDGPGVVPFIGPQLSGRRTALGLTVAQLAERTRIRSHVIYAIEVDDFTPCGGDFYARGHLRTLARVLGVSAAPLLTAYDETYAEGPVDARRVFEAELSTGAGGSIRSLRGGPNWSVIVAVVMAVVLAWSIARLVMDQPQGAVNDGPSLAGGSAGLTSGTTTLAPAVPVVLTAEGGGAKVVVRDGAGKVLFKGDLAFGQSRTVKVSPPVRVQTSDGSLTVSIDGQKAKAMGRTGEDARDTFVP